MMMSNGLKINNSYETETSNSNGSFNDEYAATYFTESDFDHQQLKQFLFPDSKKLLLKSQNNYKHLKSIGKSPMRTSTNTDPELAGCASPQLRPHDNELFPALNSTASPTADKFISPNNLSSVRTYGSEEISDQDVRCKLEMEKLSNHLHENVNLADVSGLTIEPSSSKSNDSDDDDEIEIDDKSTTIFTLSVNENSCNAVDVPTPVCNANDENPISEELSFNGKICDTNTSSISKTNENDNENSRLCREILRLETSREKINERSPDLFSDDDDDIDAALENNVEPEYEDTAVEDISTNTIEDKNDWEQKERATRKKIQFKLSGILPPPSVTYCQHDIATMLILYKTNIDKLQISNMNQNEVSDRNCNFKPQQIDDLQWPDIMISSTHGIHYNRTKHSDQIEIMYMRLSERHIGNETSSSFLFSDAANGKKKTVRKVIASPGNRLSHLAKRRAVFSSANLQSQAQLANSSKLGRKTCVIDASKIMKKDKVLTPKRRTVGGSRQTPSRKTPGSKKKAIRNIPIILPTASTATRETSKRALFLSPNEDVPKSIEPIAAEPSNRIEKSRRALFSSPRRFQRSLSSLTYTSCNSSSTMGSAMKRKRENDDENVEPRTSKLQKCQSSALLSRISSSDFQSAPIIRATSDNSFYTHQQLSASHKQKLLWAVSTALKKKSIITSHEKFNSYASVLAKVVKRLYLESTTSRLGSTSGMMLSIADRLVFYVIQEKTVDEIYFDEKSRQEAAKNANSKLIGYIAPEEFAQRKEKLNKTLSSTSRDSINLSQISDSVENENKLSERKPLTNSSSKNNFGASALRENHDSKSAQKNQSGFSGRNQKNLSPYKEKSSTSANNQQKQNKLLIGNSTHSNIMKVKRQISFDS